MQRSAEIVVILSNVKAELFVRTEDKTVIVQTKNIQHWIATRPDIGQVKGIIGPRVANNLVVDVSLENGEIHKLDIGGWYVGPPMDDAL